MNRLGRALTTMARAVGDTLWPPVCSVCPRSLPLNDDPLSPAGYFCAECLSEIEFMPPAVCPACARPLYDSARAHLCGDCLSRPPAFQAARSAAVYEGPVAYSISRLKYSGDLSQVAALTTLAQGVVRPPVGEAHDSHNGLDLGENPDWGYDVIIPMPISVPRLRRRGFNQAAELARSLYRFRQALIDERLLQRKPENRNSPGLAALTADERRRAIRGLFSVTAPLSIRGARVLLFDDVLTTGATAGEAAHEMMNAGAAGVELVTIARTVLKAWRR